MKNCCLILKKILLFFIIVCFNNTSKGQTIKKDTLAKYSFKELHDKSYASKPDSLKALLYAEYHLKKAIINKDTLKIASSYYILSSITNDTRSFIGYWNKIIDNKRVNKTFLVIGNLELGDFYYHKGYKDKALKNYLQMQKAVKSISNDSLKRINLSRLGMMKTINRNYSEALKLYKQAYNYYDIKETDINTSLEYYSLLLNLSDIYKSLKKYDSAIFYNNKLKFLSLKFKDSILYGYALLNYGNIQLKKGNYKITTDSLKKAIPSVIKDENYYSLSSIYQSLAKSYYELNDINNSVSYYKKIDSLFQKTGNYYKSQKPAYKFLISHYKKENNDTKQLEYIKKYITADSVLNTRSKNISKSLTENYDIPNLIAEKKVIENRLKGRLSTTKKWIIGIALLSTLLLVFLIHQIRKRKLYKKRFKQLMVTSTQVSKQKEGNIPKRENSIPKVTVENILNLLQLFENKHHYISSETTLSSLAKNFETNSKYLSQVINQHKGQSFNNYINSLRIDYTVKKLKSNSRFRKYSIKAISNEVGFNTAESFSKAFYKNTGIKPSYFIKELDKK